MVAGAVFIAVFDYPAEKIPVVYRVVLTAFWVDGRSRHGVGLSRNMFGWNVAAGLILGLAFYLLSSLLYFAGAPLLGISKFSRLLR